MKPEQVQDAARLIDAACDRIRELRRHRIGDRKNKQLWADWAAINKNIRATEEHGPLLAQKALWFNHDDLLIEIGSLKAIMKTLQGLARDPDVQDELAREGYSLEKTMTRIEQGLQWLPRFQATVIAHEDILAQGLEGKPLNLDDLESLENRLVRFGEWESKVTEYGQAATNRVKQYDLGRQSLSFVRRVAASLILAIASTVFSSFAAPAYAQEAQKPAAVEKADELTDKNIEDLMKYETVEQILNEKDIIKGTKLEYVKYDAEKKTTNYDELVFQKNMKAGERKPVLVLFYKNKDPPDAKLLGTAHREAIIFKFLSEKYAGQIKFLCYNADIDPEAAKNNYEGLQKKWNVQTIPSIAMYSMFDAAKGESVTKNEGEVERVDTLRGGPTVDKDIPILVKNLSTWAKYNVLSDTANETGYTYRYSNTFTISKIDIKK